MSWPISLHDDLLGIPEIAALPVASAMEMLKSVYSTLETVVGSRISAALSEDQLDEFAAVLAYEQEHPDPDGSPASAWLGFYVPNYRAIVLQEYGRLIERVRSDPAGAIRAHLA